MIIKFRIPVTVEVDVDAYSDTYACTIADAETELPVYLRERVGDVVAASATIGDLPSWWLATETGAPVVA